MSTFDQQAGIAMATRRLMMLQHKYGPEKAETIVAFISGVLKLGCNVPITCHLDSVRELHSFLTEILDETDRLVVEKVTNSGGDSEKN